MLKDLDVTFNIYKGFAWMPAFVVGTNASDEKTTTLYIMYLYGAITINYEKRMMVHRSCFNI